MFRKSFNTIFFVTLLLICGSVGVLAQTAPVSGRVELTKADGTKEPVAGALIEVYRIDIKSGFPSAKTNKKGEFSFAGILYGARFALSVSAPGCSPATYPDVKAGMDKIVILLSPGDGRKFTEDEVRKGTAAVAKSGDQASTESSPEQKKAQAEYEAKVKEIEEKNKKAEKANEVVSRALKTGNEAFQAKNYDLAISSYDEGIAADPNYVGSAPIFYNNRGAALTARGVDTYNKAVRNTDTTAKIEGYASSKKDFAEAVQGSLKAWDIMKTAPATDIVDKTNFEATRFGCLKGAIETFKKAGKTEQVDPTVIEAAKILVPEYLGIETDAAKKAEASLSVADLYRVTGDSVNAIAAYKKILETSPDDLEALVGAGLSMVNLGYMNTDKAMLQEGANYLQKFAGMAPDTNKFKADAVALIDTLKKEQNVSPQKVPSTKKKN
ncbi:hypothetical protein BH10ACI3_BH10ACI3_22200 [soil metagenome]